MFDCGTAVESYKATSIHLACHAVLVDLREVSLIPEPEGGLGTRLEGGIRDFVEPNSFHKFSLFHQHRLVVPSEGEEQDNAGVFGGIGLSAVTEMERQARGPTNRPALQRPPTLPLSSPLVGSLHNDIVMAMAGADRGGGGGGGG